MNEANFSTCRMAVDILPYMYAELSASSRIAFESHLLDCTECTDEFAEISAARFEVYEWKKLEFDPIATPRFHVPFHNELAGVTPWLDRLRASFSSTWATPAFALGGLIIVSIFAAAWIVSGDEEQHLASNTSDFRPVDARTVVTPEPITGPVQIDNARPAVTKGTGTRPVATPAYDRAEHRRDVGKPVRPTRPRSTGVSAESAPNPRTTLPRLNEFADDEDTSLRLAELLDDIGASE